VTFYVIARGLSAIPVTIATWHDHRKISRCVAQFAADIGATLFIAGFAWAGLREAAGFWWLPLFIYVAAFELTQLVPRINAVLSPSPGAALGGPVTTLMWMGPRIPLAFYEVFGVAIPLGFGFCLVLNVLIPGELAFPGTR
jgi:hypothetical protein